LNRLDNLQIITSDLQNINETFRQSTVIPTVFDLDNKYHIVRLHGTVRRTVRQTVPRIGSKLLKLIKVNAVVNVKTIKSDKGRQGIEFNGFLCRINKRGVDGCRLCSGVISTNDRVRVD
jgi:hypothetical protein